MDRSTRNKAQINLEKLKTKMYREELEHVLSLVESIKQKKIKIKNEVEWEKLEQQRLRNRLEQLKNEYSAMNNDYKNNRREIEVIKRKKKVLVNKVKNWEQSVSRINRVIAVNNNYKKLIGVLTRKDDLHPKESSMLLSALAEFIRATADNEFDDMNWRASIANSNQHISGTIVFLNLLIQYGDMKEIYGAVIETIKRRFDTSRMKIETKTKKENGYINAVEISISVRLSTKVTQAIL